MDAVPDATREMPRAPDACAAALRATPLPHRSAWRTQVRDAGAKSVLVAFVVVLGLLQGAATALGRAPLAGAAPAPDVSAPPTRELDWRRGHFFRPAGSTAARPRPALRPSVWRPATAGGPRVARACMPGGRGSC